MTTKWMDNNKQKQLPGEIYTKNCSSQFLRFHRKTPVLQTLFNNVATPRSATLLKKGCCFPVKFGKFLRTPILKDNCKQVLLNK